MMARHLPSTTTMQCFEAAARHMSFTRAAEELSLTQSAISKQIAQLESVLEHPLFRRVHKAPAGHPRGLALPDRGAQVEMSTRYMQSYGGQSEVLNVTTLPTFGTRWLIPRLNGFRFRHPGVYLNIANRVEPVDLDEERVDIAFFFGHGAWSKAECIKLLDETMVPVCAPTVVLAGGIEDPLALTVLVLLQSATRPEA